MDTQTNTSLYRIPRRSHDLSVQCGRHGLSRAAELALVSIFVMLTSCSSTAPADVTRDPSAASVSGNARVVQPGAPGEESQVLTDGRRIKNVSLTHTKADALFMQGMIAHHAQALDMTALIPSRNEREDLLLLAQRIEVSQKDEILLMQTWLRKRGEDVPEATSHQMKDGERVMMPGMLSVEEMNQLAAASGIEFYQFFLGFMISHHEGAVVMVADLFSTDGAAQDTDIFRFASDVDADQRMEITRMRDMLNSIR